jgi:hypothetical protein
MDYQFIIPPFHIISVQCAQQLVLFLSKFSLERAGELHIIALIGCPLNVHA